VKDKLNSADRFHDVGQARPRRFRHF
jgi:hypothetical protein